MADYSGYTWSALLAVVDGAIKNALGNRDPLTQRYSLPGGGLWEGRSLEELTKFRSYVADMAAVETAASSSAASRLVQATPLRRYDG